MENATINGHFPQLCLITRWYIHTPSGTAIKHSNWKSTLRCLFFPATFSSRGLQLFQPRFHFQRNISCTIAPIVHQYIHYIFEDIPLIYSLFQHFKFLKFLYHPTNIPMHTHIETIWAQTPRVFLNFSESCYRLFLLLSFSQVGCLYQKCDFSSFR